MRRSFGIAKGVLGHKRSCLGRSIPRSSQAGGSRFCLARVGLQHLDKTMTDVKTATAVEPTTGGKDGINVQAKGGIMDDVEGIITAEHLIVPASFFRFVVYRKKKP